MHDTIISELWLVKRITHGCVKHADEQYICIYEDDVAFQTLWWNIQTEMNLYIYQPIRVPYVQEMMTRIPNNGVSVGTKSIFMSM